jgi:hypothetical protein
VTSTDVAEFINQEENTLDAQIATVYEVPVTGSMSISIMKNLSTTMVKSRILSILSVKVGKVDVEQWSEWEKLREYVQGIIKKIQKKEFLLPDAVLAQTGGGVKSYQSGEALEHAFKRETEQW